MLERRVIDITIDEAIAHAREKAKEKRKEMQCKTCKLFARSDLHPLQGYCRKNEFRSIEIDSWSKVCSEYVPKEMCKCAEEQEQIAEWLEELKELRNMTAGHLYAVAFNMGYLKAEKEARNKAIDDCLLVISKNQASFRADICYSDVYDEIIQLKADESE